MLKYVHGYSEEESCRLANQANTLADILHHDSCYPPGSTILEAGCGIGAQTVILAAKNPASRFVSIDISDDSLSRAKLAIEERRLTNVSLQKADIFDLPFAMESFDHIIICFVLEHLPGPLDALRNLLRVLKSGGSLTVIEGDHGSFYCHPESQDALQTVECLIRIQKMLGGNALIGRQLYPLLGASGLKDIAVSPRMVYVDASRPELVEGFSKKTFIAMVEAVKEQAITMRLIDEEKWNKGIADLMRATEEDGTFCYTFFKGTSYKL